nr:soluble epoxide hydrolase [Quercus suber]
MHSNYFTADLPTGVRLAYQDCMPTGNRKICRGDVILLHGFPQTSYQFRNVSPLLCAVGYRCIMPDYRGAGFSSKAANGYTKSSMAKDIAYLIGSLDLHELKSDGTRQPLHVIGHDIGGMVAWSLAAQYPELLTSVCWGECPLPGTSQYYQELRSRANAVQQFHFWFHSVPDLPEALIAGKEKVYIDHFLHKITYNHAAFPPDVVQYYADLYAQAGAMRCAMEVYRAFEQDAEENRDFIRRSGKVKIPSMVLSGHFSRLWEGAEAMGKEVTMEDMLVVEEVEGADHYLSEENPQEFARVVLDFFKRVEER